MLEQVKRVALAAISAGLSELPKNDVAWTYTIWGFDQTPYVTRTLLPRWLGPRPLIHRIHRADADPHMHNHPWRTAKFLIVTGGYVEERLTPNGVRERILTPGDVNHLDAETYHRVTHVQPNTWTIGLVGDRVQGWGFLVDGRHVAMEEYFKMKNHSNVGGLS